MNLSSATAIVATRDQALYFPNNPFSQAHSFPFPSFKNGSFVPPINTQTRKSKPNTLFTASKRFQAVTACLGERNPPAKALRQILELPGVHQGPACFDGLSAKLVERAGFQYCFTSGTLPFSLCFIFQSFHWYKDSKMWVFFSFGNDGYKKSKLFCPLIIKLLGFLLFWWFLQFLLDSIIPRLGSLFVQLMKT